MFKALVSIAIPVGTSLMTASSYLFRLTLMRWLVMAAMFVVISAGGYFLAAWIIPDWFSLKTLRDSIADVSPPIGYGLHLASFYEGAPLCFSALACAWVIKKLPAWVWLGPLYRLFKQSGN